MYYNNGNNNNNNNYTPTSTTTTSTTTPTSSTTPTTSSSSNTQQQQQQWQSYYSQSNSTNANYNPYYQYYQYYWQQQQQQQRQPSLQQQPQTQYPQQTQYTQQTQYPQYPQQQNQSQYTQNQIQYSQTQYAQPQSQSQNRNQFPFPSLQPPTSQQQLLEQIQEMRKRIDKMNQEKEQIQQSILAQKQAQIQAQQQQQQQQRNTQYNPNTTSILRNKYGAYNNNYQQSQPQSVKYSSPPPPPVPPVPPEPPAPTDLLGPISQKIKDDTQKHFKSYVVRCFSHCKNEKDRDAVKKYIEDLKKKYSYNGQFYTINWFKEPLPKFLTDKDTNDKDSISISCGGKTFEFFEDRKGRKRNLGHNDRDDEKHSKKAKRESNNRSHSASDSDSGDEKGRESDKDVEMDSHSKKKGKSKKKSDKEKKADGDSEETYKIVVTRERIVGTSTQLEKPYTRTTGLPKPETVRPEHILRKSVEYVTQKWEETKDFTYVNEQFKSIRQDLIVQGIRNDFTVYVYEKHAKITLSEGCMEEFNKCSVKLEYLYTLPGISTTNEPEFTAYRLFYLGLIDDGSLLSELYRKLYSQRYTQLRLTHPVSQALAIMDAFTRKDWKKYFEITRSVDNMGHAIIEKLTQNVRFAIIKITTSTFACNLSVDFLRKRLGFETRAEILEYLAFLGVSPEADGETLNTKKIWNTIRNKTLKSVEIDNINMQISNDMERN